MIDRRQPPSFENRQPQRGGPPPGGGGRGGPPGGGRGPGGPRPPGRRPPPQRRASPPARSGGGLGSVLFYGFFGLVALLSAGFIYLMVAPPTDFIREQAISQVKEKTGRTLRIAGRTGITFYPSVGISMSDVSLSAPPGMSAPPTVKMDKLTVAVKVLPLLGSEVVVDTLVLENPVFDLRVDKSGNKSWEFAALSGKPAKVRLADASGVIGGEKTAAENARFIQLAQAGGSARSGGDIAGLDKLSLGDVRLVNGTLNYTDEAAGTRETVRAINVNVGLEAITQPLNANGDLNWKGEKVAFEAQLTTPKKILQKQPGKLTVTFASQSIDGGYDGSIHTADELKLDGAVSAQSQSVRRLARWMGSELPKATGFGPMKIRGRLRADGPVYSLRNANLGLDGATATGEITVRTDGPRPHVKADLNLDVLDLNKYMTDAPGATTGVKPASNDGGSADPKSIEDLLKRDEGTRVRGYTQRSGWSDEPIDLAGLGEVDADAELTVANLLFKNIKVGRSLINVALKDAQMRADLNEMALYDGRGSGIVEINASAPRAAGIGASFNFNGVSAQPLLNDAAEIDWLSGRGDLQIALATTGGSERQFIEALNGTTAFQFRDGAITGFNVPRAIRSLNLGGNRDLSAAPQEQTDFSELSANFKITNGIAANDDLKMLSPLLRVGGAGEVNLPAKTVDYTVRPKLVSALEGQGGDTGLSGLEIPVRIHGPLDNPSYTPDIGDIVSDPSKAVDTVKKIGEKFKGKKAGEILDGLFGGGSEGDSSGGGEKKIDGKKLLEGLFGR